MKNRFCLILVGLIGVGVSVLFYAPSILSIDVSSFVAKRNQVLQEKRQEYEAAKRALESLVERAVPAREGEPSPSEVPECDCDDPGDVYNYPDNFLYDNRGRKTYRIKPYCKCKESTFVQPLTTPTAPTITKEPETTYKWDIRY